MRHTVLGAVFALSVSAVLSFGCGSGGPPAPNSLTEVYTRIIQPTCSSDFCHYNSVDRRFGALDMSSKVRTFWSLVDQPCMGANCYRKGTRVVPGDPGNSVLYQKLSDTTLKCGVQMPADPNELRTSGSPVFSGTALVDNLKLLIQDWIQDGAYDN